MHSASNLFFRVFKHPLGNYYNRLLIKWSDY
nr:MAG TPA: hypothetical protein [Caudoviricetes sp.]